MESTGSVKSVAQYCDNAITAETKAYVNRIDILLSRLGVNTDDLSSLSDKLLSKMAKYQKTLDLKSIDETNVSIWYADRICTSMKYEEYILMLRQDIKKRDVENLKHWKKLEKFKDELQLVKNKIEKLPSSEMMQNEITILQSKISSYEQNLQEGKIKLARLNIKPEITPESLKVLIDELAVLKLERDHIKSVAENRTMVRTAKKDLLKLKNISLESDK